jgi:hypothetical protein
MKTLKNLKRSKRSKRSKLNRKSRESSKNKTQRGGVMDGIGPITKKITGYNNIVRVLKSLDVHTDKIDNITFKYKLDNQSDPITLLQIVDYNLVDFGVEDDKKKYRQLILRILPEIIGQTVNRDLLLNPVLLEADITYKPNDMNYQPMDITEQPIDINNQAINGYQNSNSGFNTAQVQSPSPSPSQSPRLNN